MTLMLSNICSTVADPDGIQGVWPEPPLRHNYFFFREFLEKSGKKITKIQVKLTNQTPFVILKPLSRNPGFAAPAAEDLSDAFFLACTLRIDCHYIIYYIIPNT